MDAMSELPSEEPGEEEVSVARRSDEESGWMTVASSDVGRLNLT